MRLVLAVTLCVAFGLAPSIAAASPAGHADEKPWHYDTGIPLATYPEVEPNDSCTQAQVWACGDWIDPGQVNPATDYDWYAFQGNAGDLVTLGTDYSTGGPGFDSYIYLYDSDCVTVLTYDDDSGPDTFSLISNYSLPHAGTFYLVVKSYGSYYTGYYKAFVTCAGGQEPPENDLCAGALPIERCTSGSLSGDLFPAHNDYDPGVPGPSCTGYTAAGKDVTYVMTLQPGDIVDLTYVTYTADTSFYIVTDCANESGTCVAGADDTLTGEPEVISWTCTTAGTYYLILDCYGTDAGGLWGLDYNISCGGLPTGACCFHPGGDCLILTQDECLARGGDYVGDFTECFEGLCPPTAAEKTTWGSVKHVYE